MCLCEISFFDGTSRTFPEAGARMILNLTYYPSTQINSLNANWVKMCYELNDLYAITKQVSNFNILSIMIEKLDCSNDTGLLDITEGEGGTLGDRSFLNNKWQEF